MKRFALIENNRVVAVAHAEKPFGENWVESYNAEVGDRLCDGKFDAQNRLPILVTVPNIGGGGGPLEP